jgi:hypothetical protein
MTRQSTIRPYPSKNFETSSVLESGGRPEKQHQRNVLQKGQGETRTTEIETSCHGGWGKKETTNNHITRDIKKTALSVVRAREGSRAALGAAAGDSRRQRGCMCRKAALPHRRDYLIKFNNQPLASARPLFPTLKPPSSPPPSRPPCSREYQTTSVGQRSGHRH